MNALNMQNNFCGYQDLNQENSENEEKLKNISSKNTYKSRRTFEYQSNFRLSSKMKEENKNKDSCNEFQYELNENTDILLDELDKPLREDKVNKCFQATLIALEGYIENKNQSMKNGYQYEVSKNMRGKINKDRSASRLGVFQRNGPDMFLFTLL